MSFKIDPSSGSDLQLHLERVKTRKALRRAITRDRRRRRIGLLRLANRPGQRLNLQSVVSYGRPVELGCAVGFERASMQGAIRRDIKRQLLAAVGVRRKVIEPQNARHGKQHRERYGWEPDHLSFSGRVWVRNQASAVQHNSCRESGFLLDATKPL